MNEQERMEAAVAATAEPDWKQACQDQTDLVNKAQGQARILEARMKAKDEAHAKEMLVMVGRLEEVQRTLDDTHAGLGMVMAERYAKVVEDLQKAKDKTQATRVYAETQRKLAIDFGKQNAIFKEAISVFVASTIEAVAALREVVEPPPAQPMMHHARSAEEQRDAEVIAAHLGTTPDKISFGEDEVGRRHDTGGLAG